MAPGGENGGNGACWTVAATSGVDGTGGGGGGGCDVSKQGGNGGCGAVIVRYADCTLLGDEPGVAVEVAETTPVSAVVNVSVPHAGASATVTLSVTVSYEEGGAAIAALSRTVPDFIGPLTIPLAGLSPGRTYFLAATADNGTKTATATTSFATDPMFTKALSLDMAGGVLSYAVDGASDGVQALELWVGPDETSMTNLATYADASLLTAGAHSIAPFTTDFLDETMAIMLRHVAVAEGRSFTNDSAVLTATLRDGATYTWNSEVSEGDWCDAANWTATAGAFRGWPAAGSTAAFPACTATVRVDRAIVTGTMTFASKDCNLRFLGTADGASLVSDLGNGGNTPFGKAKIAFDALDFTRPSTQGIKLESATELRIENGATFALSGVLWVSNPDASFTLANGSTMSVSQTANSKGVFTVDDSTYASGKFNLSYQDPAALHVLRGSNARIAVNGGFFAEKALATIRIELSGEYSSGEALIKETGSSRMAESGGVLTFEAPRSKASDAVPQCDVFVADWTKSSIDVSRIAFGEVDRKESYFYFTEEPVPGPARKALRWTDAAAVEAAGGTAKCLWYHHAGFPATIMTLR